MSKFCFGVAAVMALASVGGSAHAAALALQESGRGYVAADGATSNSIFFTGVVPRSAGHNESRGYFLFDISGISGQVSSGSFSVAAEDECTFAFDGSGCLVTNAGTETVDFYDVKDVEGLESIRTSAEGADAVFTDLGSGVKYASFTLEGANRSAMPAVSFKFSQPLLDDLNKAIADGKKSFAIGAALATIDDTYAEQGFWGRSSFDKSKLITLDIELSDSVAAVPLPATLPLLAAAFGGLGFAAKRKKRS